LDTTKKPKQIDFFDKDGDPVGIGIYEKDGDTLKICYNGRGEDRPTAFETKKTDDHKFLVVLKREKK
jgi:uncharacterized protein (TIGR03067 family)